MSAVLYADAFFELGDKSFGLSDEPPESWFSTSSRCYKNGWGFVVRRGEVVRFAHGAIPADVLGLFTSRRAFIYCLEIFGLAIAAVTCSDLLPTCWIGFCDSTAGWCRGMAAMLPSTTCWPVSGASPNCLGGSRILSGCRVTTTSRTRFPEETVPLDKIMAGWSCNLTCLAFGLSLSG